jgi:excisionase family DNA binding protein
MPCGWKCGAKLTNSEMRAHFVTCPKRPNEHIEERKLASVCLSMADLTVLTGKSRNTVYKMLRNGTIPSMRTGHGSHANFLVTRHAFDEWQKTCGVK